MQITAVSSAVPGYYAACPLRVLVLAIMSLGGARTEPVHRLRAKVMVLEP